MAGTLTISGTAGNTATWINDGYFPSGTWVAWNGDTIYPPLGFSWAPFITERKEVKEMRGLFHIYVVDYEHDQVITEGHIIADDEAKAKMKALHCWNDAVANYDLDDLDIICVKLGSVRRKKEVQEVKILKE